MLQPQFNGCRCWMNKREVGSRNGQSCLSLQLQETKLNRCSQIVWLSQQDMAFLIFWGKLNQFLTDGGPSHKVNLLSFSLTFRPCTFSHNKNTYFYTSVLQKLVQHWGLEASTQEIPSIKYFFSSTMSWLRSAIVITIETRFYHFILRKNTYMHHFLTRKLLLLIVGTGTICKLVSMEALFSAKQLLNKKPNMFLSKSCALCWIKSVIVAIKPKDIFWAQNQEDEELPSVRIQNSIANHLIFQNPLN